MPHFPIFSPLMDAIRQAKERMTFDHDKTFACANTAERAKVADHLKISDREPVVFHGIRIETDDTLKDGEVQLKGLRMYNRPFPSTEADA